MKKTTLKLAALLMGCIGVQSVSVAQVFNPPTTFEDTWPVAGTPGLSLMDHTSAYSYQDPSVGAELALSAWDDASGSNAGVSWQYMPTGSPWGVFAQGVIPYTGSRDLEVGCLDVGGTTYLMVARWEIGVGHMLDVYKIATGGPSFLYTKVLSSLTSYGRISMDCHLHYAAAITWEDWQGTINTVMINNAPGLTISGVLTLPGTLRCAMPDCAFSHTGSGLNVHYSYYDYTQGAVIETDGDYWTMLPMPGGSAPTTVKDINYTKPAYTNIDCPGHYNADNWAYTYSLGNRDICVRLVDFHSTGVPTTVVVNNMTSLPSQPINYTKNLYPFCAYDNGHMTTGVSGIYVGWHTYATDPATSGIAGYVGVHMKETGTALISAPDYISAANNPTWSSPTPILSFSKQDDIFSSLYVIFPEVDPSGAIRMENRYTTWGSAGFKTANNDHNIVHCNDAARVEAMHKLYGAKGQVTAYPNPFSDHLMLSFPADARGQQAELSLMDITGKLYGSYSGSAEEANAYLDGVNASLKPGIYFLKVTVQGKEPETMKITKM